MTIALRLLPRPCAAIVKLETGVPKLSTVSRTLVDRSTRGSHLALSSASSSLCDRSRRSSSRASQCSLHIHIPFNYGISKRSKKFRIYGVCVGLIFPFYPSTMH
ncbi:hypothetical protein BV25DRAFT_1270365 [Artomyces pyxidatus]|uniref:Uncharacterized protein n=1 Tax=Artomyces pyxidatus TaxID=48021 RepID=A0ACB8TEZ9_9AGAM|nr:hypothetical protein BV25DRAFT_1270365 [Artomyces pyxidatus]